LSSKVASLEQTGQHYHVIEAQQRCSSFANLCRTCISCDQAPTIMFLTTHSRRSTSASESGALAKADSIYAAWALWSHNAHLCTQQSGIGRCNHCFDTVSVPESQSIFQIYQIFKIETDFLLRCVGAHCKSIVVGSEKERSNIKGERLQFQTCRTVCGRVLALAQSNRKSLCPENLLLPLPQACHPTRQACPQLVILRRKPQPNQLWCRLCPGC